MKVHTGTATDGHGRKRPCAWVETTLRLEVEVRDLLYALGSRYFRHDLQGDDERASERPGHLPETLSPHQITRIYREELRHCGESTLWTWVDGLSEERQRHAEIWLTELVVGAFPEMKEYL